MMYVFTASGVAVIVVMIPFWFMIALLFCLYQQLKHPLPNWFKKQVGCGVDWTMTLVVAMLYTFIAACVSRGLYYVLYHY